MGGNKGREETRVVRYCADSWFLISAFNEDAKALRVLDKARMGQKSWILISYIAMAEAIKKFFQRGVTKDDAEEFFSQLNTHCNVQFIPVEKSIAQEAAVVSFSYRLGLGDALIAATCKLNQCHFLLSADADFKPLIKKKYLKVSSW